MSERPQRQTDPAHAYTAVRAHELMLNEAAAGLERGVVAPLLTLNGGAAAAFLTLLGALGSQSSLRANLLLTSSAVLVWVTGLVAVAMAHLAAKDKQKELNKAYRLMREMVEAELFDEHLAKLIARDEMQGQADRVDKRDAALTASDAAGDRFSRLWTTSVGCFAAGALPGPARHRRRQHLTLPEAPWAPR